MVISQLQSVAAGVDDQEYAVGSFLPGVVISNKG